MSIRSVIPLALLATACRTTTPGTHVEVVDKGGQAVYVSGAAGPGINKSLACGAAVSRAVGAIALRFAQDNDNVADDVAKAVGVENGEVFLQKYAKETALTAAVQDVQFDPAGHLCMATVRWTPPVFVKEAVLKYAEELKAAELGAKPAALAPAAAPAPTPAPAPAPAPPPPAVSVAPPPAVTAAPPAAAGPSVPACKDERAALKKTRKASDTALNDLNECNRRTQAIGGKPDNTMCHRYTLYVEGAKTKDTEASDKLAQCLNGAHSTALREVLGRDAKGHAALAMETREDGTLIMWTFSPAEETAFALEVNDGTVATRSPLAANQVQWLRQRLGL